MEMFVLLLILIRAVKNPVASGAASGRNNPFCVSGYDEIPVTFHLPAREILCLYIYEITRNKFINIAWIDIFRSVSFLKMNKKRSFEINVESVNNIGPSRSLEI